MKQQLIVENTDKKGLLSSIGEMIDEKLKGVVSDAGPCKTLPQQKQNFTFEETAKILRMSLATLKRKCNEGKIEYTKDGHFLFTQEYIDNYLNRYKNGKK